MTRSGTEQLTVLHAEKTTSKTPYSPFGDKTFVFETYNIDNNLEMFNTIVSHFVLNIPLNLTSPIRTYRRKTNLDNFYNKEQHYFILDLDDITSETDKCAIINYLQNYKCILGASKSYNGIDNFNLKGILFTNPIDINDLKIAISDLHHKLKMWCTVDEHVARKASFNAPILKNEIFLNNESGEKWTFEKRTAIQNIENIKKMYMPKNDNWCIKDLENIEASTIEKLCLKSFQRIGFVAIRTNENGSISFKHPSEKISIGGYFWFAATPYTMHHPNSTKTMNIFDTIRKLDLGKQLMKKELNYEDEFQQFNINTQLITVNERYLKINADIENAVDGFVAAKDGLISIRSPMGTGKSTVIRHLINQCHEQDQKVLIITNRISVAHDFGKKYNMKVYNTDKYNYGDSLICQFDSLWRYNIKHFDVIIMDEFISLMMHSRSNLGNSSLNIAKFFGAFNKKLVISDAFLTGYENFLLDKPENIYLIDNRYRDPTTLYTYEDKNYFINSLVLHASKHKLTVSATSLAFIGALEMLLKKRGLRVITLTASTPQSTKDLIYKLFEQDDHDKYDVLIFSPTLTVGVSNLNNIIHHFHYDSSNSTDVISSIQMLKRTRKTREIHMFIKNRTQYLKTTYNAIRDDYLASAGKNTDMNFMFNVDDYGETCISEIGKKSIKIDTFKNILEFDHKRALLWLLKYHFANDPRTITDTFSGNILLRYQKIIKTNKKTLLISQIDQFLALNNIEKTAVLMDADADKTLKTLALIDENVKDCDADIKAKILTKTLKDPSFLTKCRYFKAAFMYTKNLWDITDLEHRLSQAIINGNSDDLQFYNSLVSYGQQEIYDEYGLNVIHKNPHLKSLLIKCGYKNDGRQIHSVGYRGFRIDTDVKELYGWIK